MYCIVSASRNLRDSQGLSCPRNPPPLSSGNSGRILHGSVPYQSVPRSKLPRRSESAAGTTRAWRQDIISLPCLSWLLCEPLYSVRGKRCLRAYESAELTGLSQPRPSRFFPREEVSSLRRSPLVSNRPISAETRVSATPSWTRLAPGETVSTLFPAQTPRMAGPRAIHLRRSFLRYRPPAPPDAHAYGLPLCCGAAQMNH